MEKKILSIDFDIIMYPCIRMYNTFGDGLLNETELWDFLEQHYNFNEQTLNYDAKTLMDITRCIIKNVQNGAFFNAIKTHDQLVNLLKNQPDYDETTYSIVNVDFHHDLGYGDDSLNKITSFNQHDCTNWLSYLKLKNKTSNIEWIKAPNSEMPVGPACDYLNSIKPIREIYTLPTDFDEIYLCLSPQWIHPKFYHLFNFITYIVDSLKE